MVLDLGDAREWNLHNISIRDLNLHARCGERLGGLHAPNCPAHASAVCCDDLYVVFAVKWLQSRERFSYFHGKLPPRVGYLAFYWRGSLPKPGKCNRKTVFGV